MKKLNKIKPKNFFLILSSILFLALMVYLYVKQYYPIAFVDNNPILNIEFQKSYSISRNYYENSLKAANQDTSVLLSQDFVNDLKRAVLEALIRQKIIDNELNKMINQDTLNSLIDNKIGGIDFSSDKFKKGTEALYGASVDDIKSFVIIPKAREEILDGRLILNNPDFSDLDKWIDQKKAETKIIILLPHFSWDNNEVRFK